MRGVVILVAAMMLGLAAGYAWSGMAHKPRPPAVPRPKFDTAEVSTPKPFELDNEWAARSEDEQTAYYAGCNEVRAAGKAPLHAGECGYRSDMDGDGDGVACEPHRAD
jgi:hypothetical protein